jgi:outer membrane protein TolC
MKSFNYKIRFLLLAYALTLVTSFAQEQKISLQDAVTLANQHNAEIKAGAVGVLNSKQQKTIARSLYLPSVVVAGQANHYFQRNPFFGFGTENLSEKIPYGRFGGEDQLSATITAVQPVFNPQAIPSIQNSRLKERESEVRLQGTQVATLSLVKKTYLQILVLKERLKLQEESIRRNQRALQDARSLFLQGKALRVDTLRAYTSVKNQEPELLKLRYAVETGELELKTLIGLDSKLDIQLTDSLFIPDPGSIPDEESLYREAKNNSPEFQLVALREQIHEQQISVAAASRLPVLSAIAQYQLQSQTNNFEYGKAYYPSSSFVGLQLSVPLFNGFSTEAKVKQARLAKEEPNILATQSYDQLKARVHTLVADSHESLERLKTTAGVKETAEISYNIIQYRYKNGISSRLELADAEFELNTAQSNYLEAVYDYFSSRIELLKIAGKVE